MGSWAVCYYQQQYNKVHRPCSGLDAVIYASEAYTSRNQHVLPILCTYRHDTFFQDIVRKEQRPRRTNTRPVCLAIREIRYTPYPWPCPVHWHFLYDNQACKVHVRNMEKEDNEEEHDGTYL